MERFNHLESSVYSALRDLPTLTGLAVLALYSQVVSVPYMRGIHGPGTKNAMELIPFYENTSPPI